MALEIKAANVDGFRQVELNHVSAPRDGRVYGQLPADESIETLEQGTFVKYDYAAGKVDFTGEGPWMMVYNEEKLYDERKQSHKDYAMRKADFYDGIMTPRVFGMVAGDVFTTNNVADDSYTAGDELAPNENGVLAKSAAADAKTAHTLLAKVVKEFTMPDGQPAVKVQIVHA